MEPIVPLAAGAAAVAAVALIAFRRRSAGRTEVPGREEPSAGVTGAGATVLRPSRIVVVGDPRPSTGLHPGDASGLAGPGIGPRRRLLRDASAVLVVIAAVAVGVSFLPDGGGTGAVLSATATPGAGAGPPLDSTGPSAGTGLSSTATPGTGAPSAAPGATARTTPRPTARPASGAPSASRLAVLTPCPGRSACYLYVVRAGDTLSGLSAFFGVDMDTILRLNPQVTDPAIIVTGSTLVLPTPTR